MSSAPKVSKISEQEVQYRPQVWERIIAYGVGIAVVAMAMYLILSNHVIANDTNKWLLRILMSLAGGAIGAAIPGLLWVEAKGPSWRVRAGGALALSVLILVFTPNVLP